MTYYGYQGKKTVGPGQDVLVKGKSTLGSKWED
jgi:hypothetical protein